MTVRKIQKMATASRISVKYAEKKLFCRYCGNQKCPPDTFQKMRRMKLSQEERQGAIKLLKRRYQAILTVLGTYKRVTNPEAKSLKKGMMLYARHIKSFLEQTMMLMHIPQSEWMEIE